MSIFTDNIHNKTILEKLVELKRLGEAFNQMGGSLYSSICAGEMNQILDDLKEHHDVEVTWWQPQDGRIVFKNINTLIEEYSNGTIRE
jgi:hypothetical protein